MNSTGESYHAQPKKQHRARQGWAEGGEEMDIFVR